MRETSQDARLHLVETGYFIFEFFWASYSKNYHILKILTVLVFVACNLSGVYLLRNPVDGDSIFVREVCVHLQDNIVSRLRQLQSENLYRRH